MADVSDEMEQAFKRSAITPTDDRLQVASLDVKAGLEAALAHAPLSKREAELKAELEAENDFHNEDVESLHRHILELREALEVARIAVETMIAKAYETGVEGSSDWDHIAGSADIHGVKDAITQALSSTPPQALAARDGEVLALKRALEKLDRLGRELPNLNLPAFYEALREAYSALTNSQQAAKDAEDRILEKAARWHDEQAAKQHQAYLNLRDDPGAAGMAAQKMKHHERSAEAIRAMKDGE